MASAKEVVISARVSETVGAQVDQLAAATRRSKSWILSEALRTYIAREMQFLESVNQGIEAYKAGDVIEHDEVASLLELGE